jgi:two-component system, LytTR family, response regulator
MEIKCLIVDDEPAAIRVIESYILKLESFNIIGKCKSAFEAIKSLNQNNVDVIFLDINMPGLSGLELLKSLRKPPLVIITTAYREFAVESFELEVIDYLHKPFSFERFFKSIQRVEEKLQAKMLLEGKGFSDKVDPKDHLFIKSDKRHLKINFDNLLFIESMGDYCKFITSTKNQLSYITLKKLLDLLPGNFIRVHKSFIININKVEMVEGNIIKIQENEIPIGYSYRKDVMKVIET